MEVTNELKSLKPYWELDWNADVGVSKSDNCHDIETFENREDMDNRLDELETEFGEDLEYDFEQTIDRNEERRLSARKEALVEAKEIHNSEIAKLSLTINMEIEELKKTIEVLEDSIRNPD